MKNGCSYIALGIFVFLFVVQVFASGREQGEEKKVYENRQEIKVIDTLKIDLSKMDSTICIDGSVVMGFNSDSVFACEWIDLTTGDTVSRDKVVKLSPKTTTQYQVNLYYFTGELIPEGDFDHNVPFETGYSLGYKYWTGCWDRDWGRGCDYEVYPEGCYYIGYSPFKHHLDFFDFRDHTTRKGKMMIVNGSMSNGTAVWKKSVKVEKGRTYAFSTWGIEVSKEHPATFYFSINKKQLGKNFTLDDFGSLNEWKQFYELWKADEDVAEISLVNLSLYKSGNDFAIDDISFASMEMRPGVITVKVLPAVDLGKLENKQVCEDEEVQVNAKASGTEITGYQWSKDGTVLPTTSDLLAINKAAMGDAGNYQCAVSGECGTRIESFRLDVRENLKIEKLRDTITPCEQTSVTLYAGAQGYEPKYTWSKGTGWERDNKKETYTNPKIRWSRDVGEYTCRVSTVCGEATVYRVLLPREDLKITDWPGDMSVCEGSELRLYAGTNRVPTSIAWSGKNMSGWVQGSEYWLRPVTMEDAGVYRCIALDECMAGDSKNLKLRVIPTLTMLKVSEDTVVCENGKAIFRAEADGRKTTFEWSGPSGYKGVGAEIVIDPVSPGKEGIYQVTATDSCGVQKTEQVKVSFLREYDDLKVTGNLTVCPGEKIQLEVTGGRKDMQYEWTTPGGKQLAGTKVESLSEEGEYACKVSGTCAFVEKKVKVSLKEELKVLSAESDHLLCPGEDVVLRAEASGVAVTYEWWKENVRKKVGQELQLTNLKQEDTGTYECRIHSECGEAVLYHRVQLKELLKIDGYIPDRYVKRKESVNLFVNVTGDNEKLYRWESGGHVIPGAATNRLNVQVPDKDTLIIYTCQVSGCNTEEATFYIHVKDYQTLNQDTTVLLCQGESYSYGINGLPEECKYQCYWVYNDKDTVGRGQVLTFDKFKKEQAGKYVCYLKSDCGNREIRLSVEALKEPEIVDIYTDLHTTVEGIIQACAGEDITLMTQVKAEGLVTYEWFYEGKLIAGETDAALVLKKVNATQAGRYSCHLISGICGEDLKEVVLQVNNKPVIECSPEITCCPGQPARMEVTVTATQPSGFSWQGPQSKDWIAQNDGFKAYYSRAQVNDASEGIYYCQVDNLCGTETLSFKLNVEKDIISPDFPRYDTICPGSNVTYSIPFPQEGAKYVWTFPDQTKQEARTIQIEHFSKTDTGRYSYYIETANGCFNYTGEIHLALRKELETPVLSPDTAVCEGGNAVFTAYAEGKNVVYEWLGPKGFRAQGNRVDITGVEASDCGIYEVVATDVCNKSGKRGRVGLALLQELKDLQINDKLVVCEGSPAQLTVTGGNDKLEYEWKHKGSVKGHEAGLFIEKATGQDTGTYVCGIKGTCERVEKKVALNIYDHLLAEKEEIIPVCERENATLVVKASGEQPIYRWMRDGQEMGDRTGILQLNDVIPSDAGKYECIVSSLCGDTTLVYDFRLKEKTQIVKHSADRILCEDDDYQLMVVASGENNVYTWKRDGQLLLTTGAVLNEPAKGIADTLLYTCIVEGDCGLDSVSIVIKIGEYRKLTASQEDDLCEGSNYKYNVDVVPDGASRDQELHYCWFFKDDIYQEGSSSLLSFEEVGPEQEGEYICEITALVGTETVRSRVYLKINVMRLPQLVPLTPDIYAVEGAKDSILFKAEGDQLVWQWEKDSELTDHIASGWYFNPIRFEDKGEYKVTLSNSCSHVEGKVNVEVWKKTVIVYPQERDDSVCTGGQMDLEVIAWGESGLLYKWYLNGQLLDVPLKQPLNINEATEADQGQYVCIVTGRGGADSCKINLDVLKLPEVNIDGKIQLCRNEIDLRQNYWGSSDEARVDYEWRAVGGEMNGNINLENITVNWMENEADSLILTITSLTTKCENKNAVEIQFSPLPEVNLVVPDRVGYCQDSLKLELAYPWGGLFYVNSQESEMIHFEDKTIPYVVRYQYTDELFGCSAEVEDTIRIAQLPAIQLVDDTIQSGWCVPIVLKVKDHSEGNIYWEGEQPVDATDALSVIYQAAQYTSGNLEFWATLEDVYGCRATDSVVVTLLPSPEVVLMGDTTIGSCNELTLNGAYDTLSVVSTQWEPIGALSVLNRFQAEILKSEVGYNRYSLAVTDAYGCVSSDSVEVYVVEAPALVNREICFGDSIRMETGDFDEYVWEDGFEGKVRVLKEAGTYHLKVKDLYGCWGEAAYIIRPLPVVVLQDTSIYEGQEMEYLVEEEGEYGPYYYKWQDGSRQNSLLAKEEGWYQVTVTDELGCWVTDSTFLEVRKWYIAAPDAFLPGSSGENARFYLKEVNFGSRFEMFIYDRWGELLFKTNEIGFHGGWDGSFKGMKCQPGAYVWVAFVDGKEVGRGTLMLIK